VVDRVNSRWVVSQKSRTSGVTQVFQIPTLTVVSTLPSACFCDVQAQIAIIPSTPIVMINPTPAQREQLDLCDINTGRLLTKLRLDDPRISDRNGSWCPFADPGAHCIGVYGCNWIQLFEIPK